MFKEKRGIKITCQKLEKVQINILLSCLSVIYDRRFSPISSTNKTDRHDITEILLNVALNTITQNP
jgi:hypothetical protein